MGVPSGYTSAQVVQAVPTGINSALVYITGATFTAATSFSLPTNTFSATYKNYRIIITITDAVSDCDLTMRLRTSGTDNTSANYQTMLNGITNGGTAINSTQSGGTSFLFGEVDAVATSFQSSFDLINPVSTSDVTSLIGGYFFVDKAVSYNGQRSGAWVFANATSFDSLTFISSVASNITGYYRVYGYSES